MEAKERPRMRERGPADTLPGLREARRNAALTQTELAGMTGLTQVTISELERQARGAHPSSVRKLANALGVLPKSLYGASDEGADVA